MNQILTLIMTEALKLANKDQIKGDLQEAEGSIRETAGKATDNKKLEGEGKAQRLQGKGQMVAGNIKDTADQAVEGVKGAIDDHTNR